MHFTLIMLSFFSLVGDITVTEITTVNAVVSWTIPRFTTPEVYYVQYGDEESVLDMTTASIASPMDTSLVNQTYSIQLQGLSPGTTYFLTVVAVYDIITDRFSDLTSFRTYEEGNIETLLYMYACVTDLCFIYRASNIPTILES